MKRVIGLYGGSGAGKSTVAALLEKNGAQLIDADQISREISAPGGEAYEELKEAFPEFFDASGQLMRRALGQHVFSDPQELERLESITHPIMRRVMDSRIESSRSDVVVLDCAVLMRPAFRDMAGELWAVTAPENDRIARIMQRDAITEGMARQRLSAQAGETEVLARADRIIRNDGTVDQLQSQLSFGHEEET